MYVRATHTKNKEKLVRSDLESVEAAQPCFSAVPSLAAAAGSAATASAATAGSAAAASGASDPLTNRSGAPSHKHNRSRGDIYPPTRYARIRSATIVGIASHARN